MDNQMVEALRVRYRTKCSKCKNLECRKATKFVLETWEKRIKNN